LPYQQCQTADLHHQTRLEKRSNIFPKFFGVYFKRITQICIITSSSSIEHINCVRIALVIGLPCANGAILSVDLNLRFVRLHCLIKLLFNQGILFGRFTARLFGTNFSRTSVISDLKIFHISSIPQPSSQLLSKKKRPFSPEGMSKRLQNQWQTKRNKYLAYN
jgi:hypothetical protein